MKNQVLLLLACAALGFSSCKKTDCNEPTTAAPSLEATAKNAGKPFKGSMVYNFTGENVPCDCGSYYPVGNLVGSGNITHLGNATSRIKPCAQPLIVGGQEIGQIIGIECGSFVAANGDELYCYTYPYNLMYTATALAGTIKCDFVGGTGKFKNATGSFTGNISVPYGQGIANFTNIDGLINY